MGDSRYSRVHVFQFDGEWLGTVEDSKGDLNQPTALALKPGTAAELSPVSPPSSTVAGTIAEIPITLHTTLNAILKKGYVNGPSPR